MSTEQIERNLVKQTRKEPLFEIYMSEDRMVAYLIIHQMGVELSEVTQECQKQSISRNLDISRIYQELQNPSHKPIIIAQGVPSIPSEDARLELYFKENSERSFTEVDGVMDYRNSLKIPSVQKGEVIALKIQSVEGTAGYDVCNQMVIPAKPQDIQIVAREHVEQREDGMMIAMKEGRPRITGNLTKFLDISNAYVVSGDVSLATGNIVFSGDVVVYGNVSEHMTIEAVGNIYVAGNVYSAHLTATGSILIKGNVIKSELYSGHLGMVFKRIYEALQSLTQQLKLLVEAAKLLINQLGDHIKTVSYGHIFKLLIHNKFKEMVPLYSSLLSLMHSVPAPDSKEWQCLMDRLEIFAQLHINAQEVTEPMLLSLIAQLENAAVNIGQMKESDVNVDIGQCYLSKLQSHGDILIRNAGVLQSELYAAGHIVFYQDTAVCRGSRLEAEGSISAAIVGGHTSSVSHLKSKKKIMVRTLFSGRLCVENYCIDVLEKVENETIDRAWIMKRLRPS